MSISGTIRKQLSTAIARVPQKIATADQLLGQDPDPAQLAPLVAARAHLAKAFEQIEKRSADWATAIANLPANARAIEQAICDAFQTHGNSPAEWGMDLTEKIVELDLRIEQLQAPAAIPPPVVPVPPHGNGHINLPTLQLPEFSGNPNQYFQFWEAFQHSVDENPNLTPAQKLTYLFSRLRGQALSVVEGLPMTADNYQIAIDLLAGRYGNKDRRAEVLQGELIKLPKATAHPSSLRVLSEAVERICRQLANLGVDLNFNPILITTLKEKLPPEILTRLVEKEMDGGENNKWTPLQWRNGLLREVRIKEAALSDREAHLPPKAPTHQEQPILKFSGRHPQQHNNSRQPPFINSHWPVGRAFPVVEQSNRKRNFAQSFGSSSASHFSHEPGPSRKIPIPNGVCSLCELFGHQPTNCPTYPTPDQRQRRLQEQNRCLICGKSGHTEQSCTSRARCLDCGGAHSVIICQNNGGTGANSEPLGRPMHSFPSYHTE